MSMDNNNKIKRINNNHRRRWSQLLVCVLVLCIPADVHVECRNALGDPDMTHRELRQGRNGRPRASAVTSQAVISALISQGYSISAHALNATGALVSALETYGNITFLAPTNAAWSKGRVPWPYIKEMANTATGRTATLRVLQHNIISQRSTVEGFLASSGEFNTALTPIVVEASVTRRSPTPLAFESQLSPVRVARVIKGALYSSTTVVVMGTSQVLIPPLIVLTNGTGSIGGPSSANTSFPVNASTGGNGSLPGLVSVQFPPGSLSQSSPAVLVYGPSTSAQNVYSATAQVWFFTSRMKDFFQVRLNSQPTQDVTVSLTIPAYVSTGGLNQARLVFVNIWDKGGQNLQTMETVEDRVAAKPNGVLEASLPLWAFSPGASGKYEALFMLATTATARSTPPTTRSQKRSLLASTWGRSPQQTGPGGQCEGKSIIRPVSGSAPILIPYGRKGNEFHYGVDYGVPKGTDVKAAHNGTAKFYTGTGFLGTYVILRGAFVASIYAYLDEVKVANDAQVTVGDVIAKSGSSGAATQPSLHFEFIPNGQYFQKAFNVDPEACIGSTVAGSLNVSDNGPAPDDAFLLRMPKADGQLEEVCRTETGKANNCALGSLVSPGSYKLYVKCLDDLLPKAVCTLLLVVNTVVAPNMQICDETGSNCADFVSIDSGFYQNDEKMFILKLT